MQLDGIYCPLTTPFSQQKIAFDKLEKNIDHFCNCGVQGILVLGSSGESVLLTNREKVDVIERARKAVPDTKVLLAGTGHESVTQTCDFTDRAAKIGVAAALVITPYYYRNQMSPAAYKNFFLTVAETSKIPILIYNVPKFTGSNIPVETVRELSTHENIIGIKESSGDLGRLANLCQMASSSFNVIVGNATLFYPGLSLGANAAILALCNFAAKRCVEIYKFQLNNSNALAVNKFFSLLPLAERVVAEYGVPGIKAAMDSLGLAGGEPRAPLLPVTQAIRKEIETLLNRAELIN